MAVAESAYTEFLTATGKQFRPKALVVFSAHWEEPVTTISFAKGPLETIYDFGGFPEALYRLTYPAPGFPELAERLETQLQANGLETRRDSRRGLDHGSWVFLRHMFPNADIPIVTLSVNPHATPANQVKIGEALRGLGTDDILVIGSGTTVHNFNEMRFGQTQPEPWAVAFDDWIAEKIIQRDLPALLAYETAAPQARRAVPRAEHFVPLLLAFGSSSGTVQPRVLYRGYEFGSFSQICFSF